MRLSRVTACVAGLLCAAGPLHAADGAGRPWPALDTYAARGPGSARLAFEDHAESLVDGGGSATFSLGETDLQIMAYGDQIRLLPGARALLSGGPLALRAGATAALELPQLVLAEDPDAPTELVLSDPATGRQLFAVVGSRLRILSANGAPRLALSAGLQLRVRAPGMRRSPAGPVVGTCELEWPIEHVATQILEDGRLSAATLHGQRAAAGECQLNPGPDVIVGSLIGVQQFGRLGEVGEGMVGLGIGTYSCNNGCTPINWFALPNTDHPLIAMNLYRLKVVHGAQRLEQIGQSWLKHGFTALQDDICNLGCISSGTGSKLGVGCADPYNTGLNAFQCGLGPRSVLHPYTGDMPAGTVLPEEPCSLQNYPARNHAGHAHDNLPQGAIAHRVQVRDVDLMPEFNEGALYYAEAHYISPHEFGDPEAYANQNMFNNASHRWVAVNGPSPAGNFGFAFAGSTVRESPALDAWNGAAQIDIEPAPGVDGKAILAYQVTQVAKGLWHYEYAIYNMNLDLAIGAFGVPIPDDLPVQAIGFHAPPNLDDPGVVPEERFSNDPWLNTLGNGWLQWSTTHVAFDPQANALRFGTLYNFRFDAGSEPQEADVEITFFKNGETLTVPALAPGPFEPVVCGDGVVDIGEDCDPPDGLHCDGDCSWICGDGQVQGDEQCDPPDGKGCGDDCQIIAVCGNGVVEDGEDCDPPDGVACDANCQRIPICGDGIQDPGEACDDGNNDPGDGCSPECFFESNDSCQMPIPITEGTHLVINQDATTDGPAHPECAQSGDGGITAYDLWYEYHAECTGNLTVSTCNDASYDTDLVVYLGTDCEDLTLLECNDDAPECSGFSSALVAGVVAGNDYLLRVGGWNQNDPNSQGAAFLTLSHDNVPCPVLGIVISIPPDGAIDARQPSELDGSGVTGWDAVDIIFDEDASGLSEADFALAFDPPGPDVQITDVEGLGVNVHIELSSSIPAGHWTRLTYLGSGGVVHLGYLPGDVNGDGTTNPLDILALVDHLNGVADLPEYGTDIDRSGETQPQDILRVIDLLNGAQAFEVWNGRSLPE